MSNACVIGHISVKDAGKWLEYCSLVPATLGPWGGEVLLRGQLAEVFSGQHGRSNTVVIRFLDLEAARGWYTSDAYQALIPLRQLAAEVDLLCFEC